MANQLPKQQPKKQGLLQPQSSNPILLGAPYPVKSVFKLDLPVIATHKLVTPLRIKPPKRKKPFSINLNHYRNAHFTILNDSKIFYKAHMYNQITALPEMQLITAHFAIYYDSKRKIDSHNINSITEKFLCDALVELGKIPDDNIHFYAGSSNTFSGLDSNKQGYVEVTITQYI